MSTNEIKPDDVTLEMATPGPDASVEMICRNESPLAHATFKVVWGASQIGSCKAGSQHNCQIGVERVWYKVSAYDSSNGDFLCKATTVPGNSTVVLKKNEDEYYLTHSKN